MYLLARCVLFRLCFFVLYFVHLGSLSGVFAEDTVRLPLQFGLLDPGTLPVPTGFDLGAPAWSDKNTAFVRDGNIIWQFRDGASSALDFARAAKDAIDRDIFGGAVSWDLKFDSGAFADNQLVFDAAGVAYTLIIPRNSNLSRAALLYSVDRLKSWRAVPLVARNAMLEKRDSFNDRSGPPAVVSFENYGAFHGKRIWLQVFAFHEKLLTSLGPPLLADNSSILEAGHSGAGNVVISTKKSVFLVYPVDDGGKSGTASYIRQFNKESLNWDGPAIFLARSNTKVGRDPHDAPAITIDSFGVLHVVIGAHQEMFQYTESHVAYSIFGGWTAPVNIGEPRRGALYGRYTYPSLNISKDQTINIIARSEGNGYRFELVQMRKPWGMPFETWQGLAHKVIASPERSYYGVWRHKVTVDDDGNIYLHFSYWPNQLTHKESDVLHLNEADISNCRLDRCWYNNVPYLQTMTLISRDTGNTWRH